MFDEHDADKDGRLDLNEATACLLELDFPDAGNHMPALIEMLDADNSNDVDWDEFLSLLEYSTVANSVVDYIPLEQIVSVEFKLERKDPSPLTLDTSSPHQPRPSTNFNGETPSQALHRGARHRAAIPGQAS